LRETKNGFIKSQNQEKIMAWTQVLAANALATGAREVVKVGDRQILLLNHENQFYAVDNTCPHLKMS
jgi:nitrite reductase/ring-hydroxylating ferredoxin subunit